MFKTHKALLGIIISAFAVSTTQPAWRDWLTNNPIYQQGAAFCSDVSKKLDTYTNNSFSTVTQYTPWAALIGAASTIQVKADSKRFQAMSHPKWIFAYTALANILLATPDLLVQHGLITIPKSDAQNNNEKLDESHLLLNKMVSYASRARTDGQNLGYMNQIANLAAGFVAGTNWAKYSSPGLLQALAVRQIITTAGLATNQLLAK